MKKILILIFSIISVFSLFPLHTYADEVNFDVGDALHSKYFIFMDADTGQILSAKEPDKEISVASLTKMMTVLLAIENSSTLNDTVTVTDDMLAGLFEEEASVAGYIAGDTPSLLDLCYAAALPSAADATNAIAVHIGGSYDNFYHMMNEKAKSLGMLHTVFRSAHGLDREGQHSTARDMAILLQYALQNKTFKEIFSTKEFNAQPTLLFPNGISFYSTAWAAADEFNYNLNGYIGGKTGYTDQAGRCMAYWGSIGEMNILGVTAGAEINTIPYSNIKDIELALKELSNWEKKTIISAGDRISTLQYDSFMHTSSITVKMDKDIALDLPKNTVCTITHDLPERMHAELYDQNIEAVITISTDTKELYTKTITLTLPQETNFIGRIILHLQKFIEG